LTKEIVKQVDIITIGIGAGADTDAQVLVVNDILGITPKPPKFCKNFLTESNSINEALTAYVTAVKSGEFPKIEHGF
jgi:3-methyl-2-oxobutanoate hydroxymethyltransferase